MLTGIHFLLTYQCLFECDHCFLYCGPSSEGTFTLDRLEDALDQGVAAGITSVYFEGGEPFLYHPLLVAGLRAARARELSCGLVTNAYWATSERDAELWLAPLVAIGLTDLALSADTFHGGEEANPNPRMAAAAAERLGIPRQTIRIEEPGAVPCVEHEKGAPVVGGEVVLKGRAVEKLVAGLPRRNFAIFDACTDEELAEPGRVHVDPFGHVFVCQGLSIGNIWKKPLAEIMAEYRPREHPIVGPLLAGGPAELARRHGLPEGEEYASACHLCYLVRRNLLDTFPEHLAPRQVYGAS